MCSMIFAVENVARQLAIFMKNTTLLSSLQIVKSAKSLSKVPLHDLFWNLLLYG